MRAPSPTARPTLAFAHLIKADGYAAASGFIFLGTGNPTDPLITREGRDIYP